MRPIISAEDVARNFEAFVVLDARAGNDAEARFAAQHVAGSFHVNLDRDLAAHVADAAQGGRHPLPTLVDFAQFIGTLALPAQARIAVVDDQGGANAASRLVWMLRAAGVEQAFLVDGGVAALAPLVAGKSPHPKSSSKLTITTTQWNARVVEISEVDQRRLDPSWCVIDVRAPARYRGESETVDPIAGHIPGAINVPFADNLNADGRFKSEQALRAMYTDAVRVPMDRVIVHCGSGVTACHTLLVLEQLGMPGAALYVGSWSEWCRRPDKPRSP